MINSHWGRERSSRAEALRRGEEEERRGIRGRREMLKTAKACRQFGQERSDVPEGRSAVRRH